MRHDDVPSVKSSATILDLGCAEERLFVENRRDLSNDDPTVAARSFRTLSESETRNDTQDSEGTV